jgi:hypothetical protein
MPLPNAFDTYGWPYANAIVLAFCCCMTSALLAQPLIAEWWIDWWNSRHALPLSTPEPKVMIAMARKRSAFRQLERAVYLGDRTSVDIAAPARGPVPLAKRLIRQRLTRSAAARAPPEFADTVNWPSGGPVTPGRGAA